MFEGERTVGFEYRLKHKKWRLTKLISDPEVAKIIGLEILQEVPIVKSRMPPFHEHIKRLGLALAKHGLDHGMNIQVDDKERHWRVLIKVKERRKRPGDYKEAI